LGDELILLAWKNLLKRVDVRFVAVSRNPVFTRKFSGVKAVDAKTAILSEGLHIIGGGGLFQNKTSSRSLIYYSIPALLKKNTYLVGVGIGPIKKNPSTWIMNSAMAVNSLRIWVRDRLSSEYLKRLGFFSYVAPDLVHLLELPRATTFDNRTLVVLGPQLGWQKVVREYNPADVVVVAFHVSDLNDLITLKGMGYEGYWGIGLLTADRLFGKLAHFKKVWTGRLHGIVLASMMGASVRMAPYDPKMVSYWHTWFDTNGLPVKGYANIGKAAENVRQKAMCEYRNLVERLLMEGHK